MADTVSAKKLLREYNHKRYQEFTLNNYDRLSLPEISSVPWMGASSRHDQYEKNISHFGPHHVKFIKKNGQPHAVLWQTTAEQLKKSVRWGVIKTHSITGNVISALGQYRVVAHKRAAKGIVSNSQGLKLTLLDLYQDRFEALQELESLVNTQSNHDVFETALLSYIEKLENLQENLSERFAEVDTAGLNDAAIVRIKNDIANDIDRADSYLATLRSSTNLGDFRRARGEHSILSFVKQQMLHGLYEFQGVNQDVSYSNQRFFALTRGELNDFIEDARKEIDDNEPDLRNKVTAKHHGIYSPDESAQLTYDFSDDDLTPEQEREKLLAISFIEGWDVLKNGRNEMPTLINSSGTEQLDVIAATRWQNHRNWKTLVKSVGYYILNIFKGVFVATNPWEESSWANPEFHLFASTLRKDARPNEPLWRKPFRFFTLVFHAIVDLYKGVRDFGNKLVIRMPAELLNDWESALSLSPLTEVLDQVRSDMSDLKLKETDRLNEILDRCGYEPREAIPDHTSRLARVEYPLTQGDQNDILTAVARGLNGFSSIFSHNIFAKDPIGGILFTGAYAVGAGAIYMPSTTSSFLGKEFVDWFSTFSYSMSSSQMGAAIAGGSTLAQTTASAWDSLMHGPSGSMVSTVYRIGEDPVTLGAYFAAAYGLGYVLSNGIDGYEIPWLSSHLRADFGTVPQAAYPIIGAKVAVLVYEGIVTERSVAEAQSRLEPVDAGLIKSPIYRRHEINKRTIDRYRLASCLAENAEALPRLESRTLFLLSRQIDTLFSKEESKSLHKLLYPTHHHSIAFEVLSGPLSYIPATLRVIIAAILSLMAWGIGAPTPGEPIKRALISLLEKTQKDLTRLIVFTTHILNLPYTMVSSLLKITAYIAMMTIGRIAGLFNLQPAHLLHSAIASVHAFFRRIGDYFYPVKVLESVNFAHPTHVLSEVESTYVKLLTEIGREVVRSFEHHEEAPVEQQRAVPSLFVDISLHQLNPEPDFPPKPVDYQEIGSAHPAVF